MNDTPLPRPIMKKARNILGLGGVQGQVEGSG